MTRAANCCLCGEVRRPTQAPVEGFSNDSRIIQMADHREMREGRWEASPQMIASVSIYRNGGTLPGQTHICDGCIVVGLEALERFIKQSLAGLRPATTTP